ncbi:hypothetical protein MNBD_GAMMA11-254 [hydrothermal vent metagenome]|uniref:Uncharacterized protein n=1 Tax=hydrothermal vent metagenome TaxID=652676 RepID=A0A3B0X0N8_9ZZZZ
MSKTIDEIYRFRIWTNGYYRIGDAKTHKAFN